MAFASLRVAVRMPLSFHMSPASLRTTVRRHAERTAARKSLQTGSHRPLMGMDCARYFDSLEDLAEWDPPCPMPRPEPVSKNFRCLPQRRRVMHCHDFAGGYSIGADEDYLKTFSSWGLVDLFVYFSHHRVVVPPHIWIQKSHQEDKLILGTFLLEGSKDKAQAQHLLQSESTRKLYADRLVDVCVEYGFDGWFVNVETDLGTASCANDFAGFLHYLREQIKFRVGSHALVIYYDSLSAAGEAAHQNALLASNKAFFDACDGIFLNYGWYAGKHDTLARSKLEAGSRAFDVYAGVDVWARNCDYECGEGCKEAVEAAYTGGVSVGVFAGGWVQERGPGRLLGPGTLAAKDADALFWQHLLLSAK